MPIESSAKQCSLCSYCSPSLSQHVSHLCLVHSQDAVLKAALRSLVLLLHLIHLSSPLKCSWFNTEVSKTAEFSEEEESESDQQNLDRQFVSDMSVFDQGDQDFQPSPACSHDCQKKSNTNFVLGLTERHRVSDVAVQCHCMVAGSISTDHCSYRGNSQ